MLDTENDTLGMQDATLLLYVAGELDEAGRRTLESRLATDAGLREQLAAMTRLDAQMRADADARPVTAADSRHALGISLRLVREQALLMQSRPMHSSRRRLAGVPRWMWGTAVAASVAVGMLVWISNSDPSVPRSNTRTNTDDDPNMFAQRGEGRAFGAAFLAIEPEGSQGQPSDINAEVDALNMLAMMTEPTQDDSSEK